MASFKAEDEFLTAVFGWPTGIVTKPDNYETLRSGAGKSTVERLFDIVIVWWTINAILPLLMIVWIVRRYFTHGRDPKGKGTVIAQYDPPTGLTPGEMGTLFDERVNHRDIVATIVDLAVRGYITITEVPTKKMIGSKMDYRLTCKKEFTKDNDLRLHERATLAGIFLPDKVPTLASLTAELDEGQRSEHEPQDGREILLSDIKGKFADDLKNIQANLYQQVRDQGYFYHNPNTIRIAYVVGGLVLVVVSAFGFGLGIFGPALAGVVIALFGPFMPKRTDKGAEALWHAKGFKLFLEKAEKYRLQWQEKEHIFETYLPYAMAFGVAEKWSKTFADIQKESPSWYHGAAGSHFNSLLLWSALSNFSTTTVRSFAPPAASGSSGLGGGGFSGGGFGGGGGGSW